MWSIYVQWILLFKIADLPIKALFLKKTADMKDMTKE